MTDVVTTTFNNIVVNTPLRSILTDNFDHSYTCYYQKNSRSVLSALCDTYGSDKGEIAGSPQAYDWPSHTYADFVERHFEHCREYIKNVFECGLGTTNPEVESSMGQSGQPGASLRVWRDYFPNASIFGADIDRDVLFQDDRIRTFYCDQTDKQSISALWREIEVSSFDLMVDDGLHTFEAGITLFEHSFDKLKKGGLYIIEDVNIGNLLLFKDYFLTKHFTYDFVNLYRKNLPLGDNSLVVIRK